MPFVRRTRATFRSAEFGFFGVRVITWRHTPRRWGAPRPIEAVCSRVLRVRRSAGAFTFFPAGLRPLRTSWLIVGNREPRVRSLMTAADFAVPPGRTVAPKRATLELQRGVPGRAHTKASRARDTEGGV